MNGEIRFDTSGFHLGALERVLADTPAALEEGMEHVRVKAVEIIPYETGHLAETGTVHLVSDDTVALTFAGPYAKYQHERFDLHHPTGGRPKFLEQPLTNESQEVLAIVARELRAAE